ncbi:MAG TPA: hypothetical protein VNV38_01545 [Stellaceae bacterium]|jgi:hypothetical protein|nr:hypothetical protein [Stellaceae bacterium]
MQSWILLAILVIAELVVFPRIPAALIDGAVPLNPLGWFGYGELQQVFVDRRTFPAAYWLIVLTLMAFAAILGLFIYAVVFRSVS